MSSAFIQGLQIFYQHASNNNGTALEPCVEKIDHYKFYLYCLIPAVLLCCLFAATKTRKRMFLSKLGGRPGLVYPMDTLTRAHSISYACAFGVTISVIYGILDEHKFAVAYSGPISLTTLIAVVSMLIYGIVFFPVFASLSLDTAVSYGMGAAYVWMFLVVGIYKLTECQISAKGRILWIIRDLPSLFCLTYMSITLPLRCAVAVSKGRYFSSATEDMRPETMEAIRSSYQGIHVRELLEKPVGKPLPPTGRVHYVKGVLKTLVKRFLYHRKKGFEFPSRLVSVMFVAGCVIYMVSVEFLVFLVNMFDLVLSGCIYSLDKIGWDNKPGDSVAIIFDRDSLIVVLYVTNVLKVSSIVSVTIAGLMSLVIILHMMTSYRRNLFALYRGDFTNIPPVKDGSAISLCVGSMKFAGYQVAYLFWSFMLTCLVLFIICLALAFAIVLLTAGYTDWLVSVIREGWPGVLMAVAIYVAHISVAKYFFLQDKGQHLRLNNRRFYFVFTYFVFFFNIFVGLMSCLMRILKAIAIGVVILARLDNSTLPRAFEFFDPGFSAYRGFIHMEAAHTHPVVIVFIRVLMSLAANKTESRDSAIVSIERHSSCKTGSRVCYDTSRLQDQRRVNHSARSNWQVTYTLLNNPTVRIYRKGYIQALRKAREEGNKVPVSDKMFSDLGLMESSEQKERLEEVGTIRSSWRDNSCVPDRVVLTMNSEEFETVIV